MMAAILVPAILQKLWLKLILSDSNSFILTQFDDVSHLEFLHLGFNHFEQKKLHSFILTQLDEDSILNSAILDSDTAILDSDTLLSFLRFTLKHSLSTPTLTQSNSIWLIWWWQPSWILPSWIQPFCTKLWLKLIQSDSNSFILTQFDDVSHLEILPYWIQPLCTKTNFTHSFSLNLMIAAI